MIETLTADVAGERSSARRKVLSAVVGSGIDRLIVARVEVSELGATGAAAEGIDPLPPPLQAEVRAVKPMTASRTAERRMAFEW